MKTLAEVIEACENSIAELCFDCNLGYCDNNDCFIADALHYFKEYRDRKEMMDEFDALPDYFDLLDFWKENHDDA